MKVRIIKAMDYNWYNNMIGFLFEVELSEERTHYIVDQTHTINSYDAIEIKDHLPEELFEL